MYLSTKIIKVYRLLELKIDWLIVYNVYVQLENILFKWMELDVAIVGENLQFRT